MAIKDWRTCPMRKGLDGGIIGLTIPGYMDPPLHTNCRCFTIPYELTEAERESPLIKRLPIQLGVEFGASAGAVLASAKRAVDELRLRREN